MHSLVLILNGGSRRQLITFTRTTPVNWCTCSRATKALVEDVVPYAQSPLREEALQAIDGKPPLEQQWVVEPVTSQGVETNRYFVLEPRFHFGLWSLLPATIAIGLCLITKEPLTALLTAVVVGAFMLGRFDITDAVLLPSLASESAATILLLYLWLLGGLMGIWSRTGAAQAFAEFMTTHFVKGPRSAKLVAWFMGIVFFQGGTVSVVLVGTIVKPVADRENVSHEELAYIVDSTASPIASVLAFNAWPIYIQALIFVPGVSFLATESDRIAFFFRSVPFSFYGILAVTGTFLLSLGITRFSGRGIRAANERARTTGQLDAPGVTPMNADELQVTRVPTRIPAQRAGVFYSAVVANRHGGGNILCVGHSESELGFRIGFSALRFGRFGQRDAVRGCNRRCW